MFNIGDIVKFKYEEYPREDHQAARYEILGNNYIKVLNCSWVRGFKEQITEVDKYWYSLVELAPESVPAKPIEEFL